MKLAVASGKGGTGKTTVAVSLAIAAAETRGLEVIYLDCDVEAPNAALFLHPTFEERRQVGVLVPEVDRNLCTGCGRCAEVCEFNAISVIGLKVLVFPELCHGCGSCALNCPENAIQEQLSVTGILEKGHAGNIAFGHGKLNIGKAMATPIIRDLKEWILAKLNRDSLVILDSPPGSACPVIETVHGADYALMVTEPTPFGLHDLRQAVDLIWGKMGIPVGVVINRDGIGDRRVDEYCMEEDIPILLRIPFDREIAETYSNGIPIVEAIPHYRSVFSSLLHTIIKKAAL